MIFMVEDLNRSMSPAVGNHQMTATEASLQASGSGLMCRTKMEQQSMDSKQKLELTALVESGVDSASRDDFPQGCLASSLRLLNETDHLVQRGSDGEVMAFVIIISSLLSAR